VIRLRAKCCVGAGSPFVVLVAGAPDAGKVCTHGPGIEHGLLTTFHGQFVVETAGAGSGQLVVKVRGPRGLPTHSLALLTSRHLLLRKRGNTFTIPFLPLFFLNLYIIYRVSVFVLFICAVFARWWLGRSGSMNEVTVR